MVKESLETKFSKFYKEFISFKDEMRDVKTDVLEIKETLSNHTLALLNIENTNNIYGDMYEANKEAIRKLDTRVANLENS